jgi:PAS domain S-box-containing protein
LIGSLALNEPQTPSSCNGIDYQSIFDQIDQGMCLMEVLLDGDERPVDYRFLHVNPAFERQTGLVDARGRTARELVPDLDDFWFETYGRIALKGQPERFESHAPALKRWFEAYAFPVGCPERRQIGLLFSDITERKHREAHASLLDDISLDMALLSDETTVLATVARKAAEHLELSHLTFTELLSGEADAQVLQCFHEGEQLDDGQRIDLTKYLGRDAIATLQAGKTLTISNVVTNAHTADFAASYQPLSIASAIHVPYMSDGSLRFIVAAFDSQPRQWRKDEVELLREITSRLWLRLERGRSDKALRHLTRETERRSRLYEAITSTTPDLQYVFDLDYRFTYANEALLRMWGRSWEESIGLGLLEIGYEPWHAAMHEREIDEVIATGKPIRGEVPFHGTNGRRIYDYIFAPVFGEDGSVEAVAGTTRDITEIKLKEEALRESEQRFRIVADTAPAMLWVTDEHGQCTFVSRGWYEYTVQQGDEGLGLGWLEAVHPEDRAHSEEAFFKALENRAPFEIDHRLEVAPGEFRWAVEAGRPRFDASGRFVGYVGSVVDVHERKMHEQALIEADQRKDQFMAVLSHELRNPLAPIRNSLYVLNHLPQQNAEACGALEILGRQVEQLSRLVDDLLEATRISQNKIELRRSSVELNELVAKTVKDHEHLFRARQVSLEFHPADDPVPTFGDANRLAQVIGNLLHNAVKFTPGGQETVVSIQRLPRNGEALITVRDTGLGMTRETLDMVFEPFVQADASLEHANGGLGLGLALVKGLVQLHQGKVSAHSDGLGKGSRIEIVLPLHEEATAQSKGPKRSSAARPRRVLLIEDNLDVARSMRMLLELKGHEVAVAHSGKAGIERARQYQPDIVLCDIGLPETDGYTVARLMRQDPELEDIFLIALSGYAMPSDIERAHDSGFERHLAKPPNFDTLDRYLAEAPYRSAG